MENLLDKNITAFIGSQKYLCTVTWRNGILIMDEPNSIGGKDLGPDPYSTLLASLAGCTLSTLKMYIDRKGWQIPEINISLNFTQNNSEEIETVITREISFPQQVTEKQQERLKVIAEKCPVSKILKNKITINTKI
ncbi:OsmC family protein [Flavobacterium croceum]|uniref:OsmC family protein n=1 Tax=Flavobacterium croceum TaxID=370975 RepID=UPI0024A824BB|nr:OsmC family protein [Flavobacterium croceum]